MVPKLILDPGAKSAVQLIREEFGFNLRWEKSVRSVVFGVRGDCLVNAFFLLKAVK